MAEIKIEAENWYSHCDIEFIEKVTKVLDNGRYVVKVANSYNTDGSELSIGDAELAVIIKHKFHILEPEVAIKYFISKKDAEIMESWLTDKTIDESIV